MIVWAPGGKGIWNAISQSANGHLAHTFLSSTLRKVRGNTADTRRQMGIDAVAILRIARLPEIGDVLVTHRGDATLINTMVGFDAYEPDEHALVLRNLLGPDLDAHDDPRGILFFPDVGGHPKASTYAAMVREKEHGGVWAPMVAADYLPARYARAGTHDGLIGEMIAVTGRDRGMKLAILTEMRRVTVATGKPGDPEATSAYQASIADITAVMGAEFAARFDKSVTDKVDAWPRAHSS